MANLITGADVLRNFTRQYEALRDLAATVEELGSLDQAKDEREKALAEAQARLDVVTGELQTAGAALADAHALALAAKEQAEKDAAAITEKATQEAAALLAEAEAKADTTIELAEEHAAAEKAKAGEEVDSMLAQANAAKASKDEAIAQRDAALEELKDVEAKLAAARESIKTMLGG